MKRIFLFLAIIVHFAALAENDKKAVLVQYDNLRSNCTTILYWNNNKVKVYDDIDNSRIKDNIPEEVIYINYNDSLFYDHANYKGKDGIYRSFQIKNSRPFKLTDEYKKILGYKCRKATRKSFSNQIGVWFTDELNVIGTPLPHSGSVDGLVLSCEHNGKETYRAKKIELLDSGEKIEMQNLGRRIKCEEYPLYIKNKMVERIKIFDDIQLAKHKCDNPKKELIDHIYKYKGGTLALKKVKLPKADSDNLVFMKVTQYSNGDAYDRTGTVFLIPNKKSISAIDSYVSGNEVLFPKFIDSKQKEHSGIISNEEYDCPIELMRFFTPFGIKHFNKKRMVMGVEWENECVYKQDITHYLTELQGEVWIGAQIGSYSKGGHKLTVELEYYPRMIFKNNKENSKYVQSLFNNMKLIPGQKASNFFSYDSLSVDFNVPENVKNLHMMFITTGHGGFSRGDEFIPRKNTIYVDGKKEFVYVPWRNDCATYRNLNPASGNFWNGISSSDLSRSNWCPGTATNPIIVPLSNLTPGKHRMNIKINQGRKGSSWIISGVLLGNKIEN